MVAKSVTEEVTEYEQTLIGLGTCPDCLEQLYKGSRGGLAMNIACKQGHTFWVAPLFIPQRITPKPPLPELKEE